MAADIAWLEPFDLYPNLAADGVGCGTYWNFPNTGGISLIAGLLSGVGYALYMDQTIQSNIDSWITRAITATTAISVGFFYYTKAPTGSSKLWSFKTVGGSTLCYLQLLASGQLQACKADGTVRDTGLFPVLNGAINHFAIAYDASAGTMQVWINGNDEPDIDATGLNTGTIGLFGLYRTLGNAFDEYRYWAIDHIVCMFDTAEQLPELELYPLGPNADESVQFTPSTGTDNWAVVDDIPVNNDTDYNASNNLGDKDLLTCDVLPFVPDYVWCVSQVTTARKTESATQTIQQVVEIESVEYNSADLFLSVTYSHHFSHRRQNPATLADWLPDEIPTVSGYVVT